MSEWIDVNDSLPKDGERVLIYCPGFGFDIDYFDLGLKDGNFWSVTEKECITHWMPLPEPPKKKHFCSNGPLSTVVCYEEDGKLILESGFCKLEAKFCPFCGEGA